MKTELIKDRNMQNICELLAQVEKTSISELARETGLSIPTVTRLLLELCEQGKVEECLERNSTGGRAACQYALNANYSMYLLIAIEGLEITWHIRNLNYFNIDHGSISYLDKGLLATLDELILTTEKKYPNIKTVAIGIAAMIAKGIVKEGIWEELKGINLPVHFANLTSIPVVVDNDMHIVALGQWHCANHKPKAAISLYFGIGCCFGAGIILEGSVWRGACNYAGEIEFLPGFGFNPRQELPDEEIIELYCKLICSYAALINPDQVTLYDNHFLKGDISTIRKNCLIYLPTELLPNIEISDEFDKHYETGLFQLALETGKTL